MRTCANEIPERENIPKKYKLLADLKNKTYNNYVGCRYWASGGASESYLIRFRAAEIMAWTDIVEKHLFTFIVW